MGSLNRSPVLKRIDDEAVWSIVCFFVADECRGRGIVGALINSAIEYVRAQGGRILEAYPRVDTGEQLPPVSSFMGTDRMFEQAGFSKISQPSSIRTIYRLSVTDSE
jgi:predicted GNAT family acetyltransferase